MLKLPQVELSKADKIRLLERFYNLLETKQKKVFDEIQDIINENIKKSSKKDSNALYMFASYLNKSFEESKESVNKYCKAIMKFLNDDKKIDWDYVESQNSKNDAIVSINEDIDPNVLNSCSKILERLAIDTSCIIDNFKMTIKD